MVLNEDDIDEYIATLINRYGFTVVAKYIDKRKKRDAI